MSEKYKELLEEMLDLAGISLEEAEAEEKETDEVEDETTTEEPDSEVEAEDEADEELSDKWSVRINTGSKMEIEFLNTFVYVWYRNKRSGKIEIPAILRKNRQQLSKFMNEILSHVEKVS